MSLQWPLITQKFTNYCPGKDENINYLEMALTTIITSFIFCLMFGRGNNNIPSSMMDSNGYKCQSLGQRKEIGDVEYSCQIS
jgi:hypothetical protein